MTGNSNMADSSDAARLGHGAETQDPYAILGVSRDASYDLIRRAYREKAKLCHPDLGSEPGREEEFKLLNWAHRIVGENHRASRKSRSSYETGPESGLSGATSGTPRSLNAEILEEGRDRFHHGNAAEAERLARYALQRTPGETAAYLLLSEALAAQRRFAEAVGCLLIALQFDRDCADARTLLGKLQARGESG